MISKKEIRESVLKQLKELQTSDREAAESTLIRQFSDLIKEKNYRKIGFYYGVFPELTTEKFFREVEDIEIYLPRMLPEKQLAFHLFNLGDEVEIVWGIQQPLPSAPLIDPGNLDLLVVPGVAFDPQGFRVGFGGGFYDRLLAKIEVPTVSLIFQEQYFEHRLWEINEFDLPVDKMIIDERERF